MVSEEAKRKLKKKKRNKIRSKQFFCAVSVKIIMFFFCF